MDFFPEKIWIRIRCTEIQKFTGLCGFFQAQSGFYSVPPCFGKIIKYSEVCRKLFHLNRMTLHNPIGYMIVLANDIFEKKDEFTQHHWIYDTIL